MKMRKLFTGLAALLAIGFSGFATAQVTQLGIAIDTSGSVNNADYTLQTTGLANALAAIPTNSSVEITVVQFASSASVIAGPVLVDSQATLDQLVSDVGGATRGSGGTTPGSAIDLLTSSITNSANFDGGNSNAVINVSTDGGFSLSSAQTSATDAQDAGIDALTAEAIGQFADTDNLVDLVFNPSTNIGDGTSVLLAENAAPPSPLDVGQAAWVVPVSDFAAFEGVITSKINAIVTPPVVVPPPPSAVPEPGAIALLGIGILAFVFSQILRRPRRTDMVQRQLIAA